MTTTPREHDWSDDWAQEEWPDDDGAPPVPWAASPGCHCRCPGRAPGFDDDGPDDDLIYPVGTVLGDGEAALDVLLPLIGPERAGPAALWALLVDEDDRTLPVVIPLDDTPARPDAVLASDLVAALALILAERAPGGGLVFAVVRRAGGDRGTVERGWEQVLAQACEAQGVRLRGVCAVGRHRARVLRW
ncbi:hypothetical protein IC607_07525 [Cellulomonas sp. JH27-2]|uniref:hypothetical protein n=1 Tax=Cellulomonas sp. JH27-2 TaxID=2774139 RepID=UPI00177EB699|nr:hypothetical protein [Cellulomonas sp. JH27-2]MBD8058815.1 hypothetical protein [Cellulomonas sp. JH27-2]